VYLAEKLSDISRTGVQKLIRSGEYVFLNGAPTSAHYPLKTGDRIRVVIPPPAETGVTAAPIPLDILHEDGDLLVINKQPGVPVHPAPGHRDDTIVNGLLHHLGGTLSDIGGELRPGIVHRLDKDTSGVLVVAKTNGAHIRLSRDFAERRVAKTYEAIVKGDLIHDEGCVEEPIGRSRWNRKKFGIDPGGRHAVTRYRVVDRKGGTTWVMLYPETGRTHQLRVHMAHLGHPVVNDPIYGRKKRRAAAGGTTFLALLAREISFEHPRTGVRVRFTAPYPPHFTALRKQLGYAAQE
jgi:23S rRNA pseudouridine1911/1915/1917 synthase